MNEIEQAKKLIRRFKPLQQVTDNQILRGVSDYWRASYAVDNAIECVNQIIKAGGEKVYWEDVKKELLNIKTLKDFK
jgi:hypothetical protein